MRDVVIFGEDYAHEVFLKALTNRLAVERELRINVTPRSVRGGRGRALKELREYTRDVRKATEPKPDLLIVAIDANCEGPHKIRQEIRSTVGDYDGHWTCAVPDPHIERWLLLDSSAFGQVLGSGCQVPKRKCERDLYKRLLRDAVERAIGIVPPLNGLEYASDIVDKMNLDLAGLRVRDRSLAKLVTDLVRHFEHWRTGTP